MLPPFLDYMALLTFTVYIIICVAIHMYILININIIKVLFITKLSISFLFYIIHILKFIIDRNDQ